MKIPGPPLAIKVMSHSVQLVWKNAPEMQDGDGYEVAYRETTALKWTKYVLNEDHSQNSTWVEGLKSGTFYNFKVKIVNRTTLTDGQYSEESDDVKTSESTALQMTAYCKTIPRQDDAPESEPYRYILPLSDVPNSRNKANKTKKKALG